MCHGMQQHGIIWRRVLRTPPSPRGSSASQSSLVAGSDSSMYMRLFVIRIKRLVEQLLHSASARKVISALVILAEMVVHKYLFIGDLLLVFDLDLAGGFQRKFAVQYSNLLSIPVILGATTLLILNAIQDNQTQLIMSISSFMIFFLSFLFSIFFITLSITFGFT